MTSRADSLTFEDLQKAKESGMADIVEKLRNIDNISGDIEESEIERISIIGDAAAAEIERLRAEIACWRENSIDAHAALSAMRNSINDYLPMPSIESDLLQGPETSVFCAAVATSVIAEVCRLRAALVEARRELKSECERRDEIIATTTKLWNDIETDNIKLKAALAEAREVMKPFNGMTYKHQLDSAQVYITSFDQDGEEWAHGSCRVGDLRRLVQWLERNP